MQGLLAEANNRYLLFNNNADLPEREQQVDRLLQLVRQVVQQNDGCYFKHRVSRMVDKALSEMVKTELRDRAGVQLSEFLQDKLNIHTISTSQEGKDDRKEEKASAAERDAIMRKKELEIIKRKGAVKDKLDAFKRAISSEDETQADQKSCSRANEKIKQPPALPEVDTTSPDPHKGHPKKAIAPAPPSPRPHSAEVQPLAQPDTSSPSPREDPPKPARAPAPPSPPQCPDSGEVQQLMTAGEDTVWDWGRETSQTEQMLDDFQEELINEQALDSQSTFIYNVPDKPGMTMEEKRRAGGGCPEEEDHRQP